MISLHKPCGNDVFEISFEKLVTFGNNIYLCNYKSIVYDGTTKEISTYINGGTYR